jgi:hypothetical protein
MLTKLGSVAQEKIADATTREAHRLAKLHGREAGQAFLHEMGQHPSIKKNLETLRPHAESLGRGRAPDAMYDTRPENRGVRESLLLRKAMNPLGPAEEIAGRLPGGFSSSRAVGDAKRTQRFLADINPDRSLADIYRAVRSPMSSPNLKGMEEASQMSRAKMLAPELSFGPDRYYSSDFSREYPSGVGYADRARSPREGLLSRLRSMFSSA